MTWFDEDRRTDEEKRREVRRKIKILCVIYDPSTRLRVPAEILNISQRGAGIRCADASTIPDAFVLFIRGMEAMRRDCVVVRRTPTELGVRFRHR
ncbi:PilZ domain-containing protein [Salinarimonas sp.]|uniref:PilZ domain-containing protein n=1 Tax=Salinarimonas sp. TaxID=2766526 RepID=UPI0032D9096D